MRDRIESLENPDTNPFWLAEQGIGFGNEGLPLYNDTTDFDLSKICLRVATVEKILGEEGAWDLICLSNIMDTMGPEKRVRLLETAVASLNPNGRIVLRSMLFDQEDLPEVAELVWEELPSDQSPICPVWGCARKSQDSTANSFVQER